LRIKQKIQPEMVILAHKYEAMTSDTVLTYIVLTLLFPLLLFSVPLLEPWFMVFEAEH